ncbi:MAG: anthranilate/aminodeoxychorismate synthase component II, partial [Planctomycetes bacterium]|nr:anthranilate/aminodeoxychorismate synthase component II [Planctomycetota bacterium]
LHEGRSLFAGLPTPLRAARYHSLHLPTDTLPACLEPLAATPEGILMAMRHRDHPSFGVQFHPESFRSPDGPALLAAFLETAR